MQGWSGACEVAEHPDKCLRHQSSTTQQRAAEPDMERCRPSHHCGKVSFHAYCKAQRVFTMAWAVLYRKPGAGLAGEEAGIGGLHVPGASSLWLPLNTTSRGSHGLP